MKKNSMLFQIPTLFGLEGLVADELKYRGFQNVRSENGKVFFTGDWSDAARANLWTRCGERVLIVLAQFTATSFEQLFAGVKNTPFENFIGSLDAFPVKGWSLNSKLYSVPDCQKIIKKAIVERLRECYGITWFQESGPTLQVQFSIMKDEVTLMLDTSGEALHKRGYRQNANEAPIRETLAAGIADLSRVHSDSVVADPMCGSGTLLIESALKAFQMAPGLKRRFQMESWGCFPKRNMLQAREEAIDLIKRNATFEGFGYDIDPRAIELSQENAQKAGVGKRLHFEKADISRFKPERLPVVNYHKVIVLCNPPYGERLLDIKQAQELYKTLGVVMKPLPYVNYSFITPDEDFEQLFGRKADKRRKLYNGMLKCQLYMYYK